MIVSCDYFSMYRTIMGVFPTSGTRKDGVAMAYIYYPHYSPSFGNVQSNQDRSAPLAPKRGKRGSSHVPSRLDHVSDFRVSPMFMLMGLIRFLC